MSYWLMKSEPSTYNIDDLIRQPGQTDCWDGIRNYQVRNMMRDEMTVGDLAFFYYSSCDTPGIVGIIEIASLAYPDTTAFDPDHHHYDSKSTPENPRWLMIDVRFQEKFDKLISLAELKIYPELQDMLVLQRGNRLSITPITPKQWQFIVDLARQS